MQRNANLLFRGILSTAPMSTNPKAQTILYCALSKNACRQYIAMAKSFLRFCSNVAVVVQDDGSLDVEQYKEIKNHILGVKIYSKNEMFEYIQKQAEKELLALLPTEDEYQQWTSIKIMYLKFLNVVFRFNGRKVIIVDSDLLFLRPPRVIIDWVESHYNSDFYGEGGNAKSKQFYDMGFSFDSLDIANFSSGTIGVGGSVSKVQLLDIFKRINEYDRELYKAWEIEQAIWAVVMSQRPNPLNLDSLKDLYIGSGWKSYRRLKNEAIIAHFAGAVRFNNFRYLRLLSDLILELKHGFNTVG